MILDGTFRSSSAQWHQLLAIQFYIFRKFIPLIFVILKEKTEEVYKEVLRYFKLNEIFKPDVVVTDFKRA